MSAVLEFHVLKVPNAVEIPYDEFNHTIPENGCSHSIPPASVRGDRRGRGLHVDFTERGVPGLKASAIYAYGRDQIDTSTGAPIPNQNETDVRLDYAFPEGTILEGLVATFRYAWTHQDGAPQNGNQLRAYLNYAFRF